MAGQASVFEGFLRGPRADESLCPGWSRALHRPSGIEPAGVWSAVAQGHRHRWKDTTMTSEELDTCTTGQAVRELVRVLIARVRYTLIGCRA
jgi:hypothetical protein